MSNTILNDLKNDNNFAFGEIYKENFNMVRAFVTKNSGKVEDVEDVFQDTMMVLVEKLRQDNFELTASIKTYVMAITKNIWFKKLRNKSFSLEFTDNLPDEFMEEIDLSIENEKDFKDKLQNLLHKITKHCQGIIHDIFFKEKSIEQIQKEYGYSTKHNAQNQKHKCVEQIKKVKEKSS